MTPLRTGRTSSGRPVPSTVRQPIGRPLPWSVGQTAETQPGTRRSSRQARGPRRTITTNTQQIEPAPISPITTNRGRSILSNSNARQLQNDMTRWKQDVSKAVERVQGRLDDELAERLALLQRQHEGELADWRQNLEESEGRGRERESELMDLRQILQQREAAVVKHARKRLDLSEELDDLQQALAQYREGLPVALDSMAARINALALGTITGENEPWTSEDQKALDQMYLYLDKGLRPILTKMTIGKPLSELLLPSSPEQSLGQKQLLRYLATDIALKRLRLIYPIGAPYGDDTSSNYWPSSKTLAEYFGDL